MASGCRARTDADRGIARGAREWRARRPTSRAAAANCSSYLPEDEPVAPSLDVRSLAGWHARSRRRRTRRPADLRDQRSAHGGSSVRAVPDRGWLQPFRHGLSDAEAAAVSEFVTAVDGRPSRRDAPAGATTERSESKACLKATRSFAPRARCIARWRANRSPRSSPSCRRSTASTKTRRSPGARSNASRPPASTSSFISPATWSCARTCA